MTIVAEASALAAGSTTFGTGVSHQDREGQLAG
jgi:hypothetical protein